MPVDLVVLAVAAVLAVVALVAAVVALRAVREARLLREATVGQDAGAGSSASLSRTSARQPQSQGGSDDEVALRPESDVRVVEGRVIVTPTKEQVVAAQLTRPSTRFMIVVAGVAHALRPES